MIGHVIVILSCWLLSILAWRTPDPRIAVGAIVPGSRVVVMPMVTRNQSRGAAKASHAVGATGKQATIPKEVTRLKKPAMAAKQPAHFGKSRQQPRPIAAKKNMAAPAVAKQSNAQLSQEKVIKNAGGAITPQMPVCEQESFPAAEAGTIVVSSAAELYAVKAVQEIVVGLQQVWHPPLDMQPQQPLVVVVAIDAQGRCTVQKIQQSSGILIYDMQAKQAIASLEPLPSAASMTLTLEF
ncbi:TonB C-terminal domain-containing protein [Candidatus Dependentiae bacterium]|nr:TonB C-terminal domain-containing protein [Candidatus Dependentiae bacterium]